MDEKHLLGDWTRNHRKRDSRFKSCVIIASIILCFYIVSDRLLSSLSPTHKPRAFRYNGENISWESCGDFEGSSLECSTVDVPMDQFNPENSGTKSFTIPLIRMRGSNATQNLLLNPGGPGGSGFEFLYRRGEQLKAIIGEGFHLLSFDPRGINSSTPTASCYPDEKTRQELSRVRSLDLQGDSPEVYAWAQNFAKACPETMGEYAKYLNTPQTAADMNSILDALGQKDMIYWGFSYGSLLGQTYATLFPERSKRVIIDGIANQFEWYEDLFEAESLVDTDKVLDGFFDECIKAGAGNCPLASLATSKDKLRDTVLSYLDALKKQPVSVYIDNSLYGLLDYGKVWYNGFFEALYKPPTWTTLADNIYKLIQGNATAAFLAYGIEETRATHHEGNDFITLNDGLSGPDHWPRDRQAFLDEIVPLFNLSMFGGSQIKGYHARQHWAVPKTHSYVPRKGVKTAHPLLILSTTYDPVCPRVSARSANEAFEGSQIVELKAYGHCSVAVPSVCIAKHVRAFLYEGKLPEEYTQCEVDSPYFQRPDKTGQLSAHKHFDDAEDAKIHQAQVVLAREWDFAPVK
ncbi:Alpha/Beta hydrolase protein [Penicillium odoratum]|uniref:Alpha/Beta hydrolase protein n=1 Tax=Penicillium odoratum TaxID=1167516 RepID=UPI00254691F1|nr:Alpha/Beta hydrolase protein [Penicillium odoratum]KAJ5778119.1 Alpha/Beta hydrolase protein [Penicillium odoratum]